MSGGKDLRPTGQRTRLSQDGGIDIAGYYSLSFSEYDLLPIFKITLFTISNRCILSVTNITNGIASSTTCFLLLEYCYGNHLYVWF